MLKTAESVSTAHPDKMCDQISDLVLDRCIEQDPMSRVAIETMGGHGQIHITGELTTQADIDFQSVVSKVLSDNRYNPLDYSVSINVVCQSKDIAQGVDIGGAGDQGIMVGYATDENEEMIPNEVLYSRRCLLGLWGENDNCRDAKSQVTTKGSEIDVLLVSAENISSDDLMGWMSKYKSGKYLANPSGDWSNGGFEADTGVTGRKLAVDNYGPQIPIGGGAFSGKDPTKVDRSGAYMARKIAVDFVRKNGGTAIVKIAYAIGVPEPVMVTINDIEMPDIIKMYDLRPRGIIDFLDLRKPIYYNTAKWGHFGRGFQWDL